MGKLDCDPQILHFSHPHPLELNLNPQTLNLIQNQNQNQNLADNAIYILCASCKLPANNSDDYIYSCSPCNFHIHLSCTKFPQLITHPSHASHPLTLLPVSMYPGGLFNCDACNRRGNGFSYHCNLCDFDLHVVCASKPLSVLHYSHAHPLLLTFKNPYETKGFSCDICSKIGSKQWLYRCGGCEFDAHLHCATGALPPPLPPQPQHFSGGGMNQFNVPAISGRNGGISGRNQNYPAHGIQTQQIFPAGFQYNGNTSGIQAQQNFPAQSGRVHQNYPATSGGGGIMGAAIQGLVEGAAQQVGQNLMQSLIGGGSSGGGGGDGSTSSNYVDLGPTFTDNQDSSSANTSGY